MCIKKLQETPAFNPALPCTEVITLMRQMYNTPKRLFLVTTLLCNLTSSLAATTISVSASASHAVPTTLFGQMFEDINHSGDGGLYAELLQNRAFQRVTPNTQAALSAWHSINQASIVVIADPVPVSAALPNSLQLTIPPGTSDKVGFGNEGYWGIKVEEGTTYKASFYYKVSALNQTSPTKAPKPKLQVTAGLQAADGTILASASKALAFPAVPSDASAWTQVKFNLKATASPPSPANNFTITIDASALSGSGITLNFAMFSLFPPTFKGRDNGLRKDIAEALLEMKPAFFRFPGGNNLVSIMMDHREFNDAYLMNPGGDSAN
ncbi:hypothetical protein HGRIS_000430 [Hohenbuehelia grisea]|uniref:CBM-cenC domain-containing protein n=1 Tax=Hohenbuehelia grisea TaxID=104357 RepID=A0ABR3JR13_9AGAR